MLTLGLVCVCVTIFIFPTANGNVDDDYKNAQILAYYSCLSKREGGTIISGRVNPIPVVVETDQIAVLPCIDCRNPARSPEYWSEKKLTWYYRLWEPDSFKTEVPLSARRDIKAGFYVDKTYHNLIAIGVNNTDFSGEYFCEDEKDNILSSYDLDVVLQDKIKILVPGDQFDSDPDQLTNFPVEVITEWSMWTGCNRCGTVAERRRYGKCIVKPIEDLNPENLDIDLKELFRRYPVGVPCRFSWLPLAIQLFATRPNYLQSELCHFDCVTEPPLRYITERTKGFEGYRVIEKVKRNRFSIREFIPGLPPPVLRIIRDTVASDGLAIYCPAFDEEIFWKKGDNKENTVFLTTMTLHAVTADRIYMDENKNLVFDYLEGEDQGIFSCWNSEGILLMTATINVAEPAKDTLIKTTLVLTGIIIVCFAGFYIIWSSFRMKQ